MLLKFNIFQFLHRLIPLLAYYYSPYCFSNIHNQKKLKRIQFGIVNLFFFCRILDLNTRRFYATPLIYGNSGFDLLPLYHCYNASRSKGADKISEFCRCLSITKYSKFAFCIRKFCIHPFFLNCEEKISHVIAVDHTYRV